MRHGGNSNSKEGELFWLTLQTLVSASTIGTQPEMSDAQLADAVKAELGAWYGADETATWQLLRIYRILFAQPNQVMLCYPEISA